jgi:hypothetical protein
METLRNQHKAVIIGTFTVLAVWYYFFYYHYHVAERPQFELFAALGVTLPGFAYLPILFYEKFGWRIVNPHLDFDDRWAFLETQSAFNEAHHAFEPAYEAWGFMRVRQNIGSVAVVEGQTFTGPDGAASAMCTWSSMACDLSESGELVAALGHLPSPGTRAGNVRYGIEVFRVTMRDDTLFGKGQGRPTEMSSIVYHCIEKEAPANQVDVKYIRLPRRLQSEHVSSKKIRQLFAARS